MLASIKTSFAAPKEGRGRVSGDLKNRFKGNQYNIRNYDVMYI